jgi:hypothetical protein
VNSSWQWNILTATKRCTRSVGAWKILHDVIVAKTNTEDEKVADSTGMTWACVPSTREESHRILAAYKRSLEVRRMFNQIGHNAAQTFCHVH